MYIEFYKGYWTLYINDAPFMACVSFESAVEKLEMAS